MEKFVNRIMIVVVKDALLANNVQHQLLEVEIRYPEEVLLTVDLRVEMDLRSVMLSITISLILSN